MSFPNETEPKPSDAALPIESAPQIRCCNLSRAVAPLLLTVTVASLTVAAYFVGRNAGSDDKQESVRWNLPAIDATASATSEKFSIATGVVSAEAEGFFVLDHNSGLVQCNVLYPRMGGQILAQFTGNVMEGLGAGGKGGQYIMVTGQADFPTSSNNPAGSCVLYVLDTSTGNFAYYGVPFNRVTMNAGRKQNKALVLLGRGTANPLIDRDSLR